MNEAAEDQHRTYPRQQRIRLCRSRQNWARFQTLSCQLSLEIPIPGFTIAALLRLSRQ